MEEIDSRDQEQAWPELVLKLEEFHAQLPPLEASVFETITGQLPQTPWRRTGLSSRPT